jgi:pyruvate dehydrogenase E1 component alpha subunit
MGAIWDLPVLWVVENNLYGASTHVSRVMKVPHIADRAAAYGMPGVTVDGNDVIAVYEATREAADRARSGKGPTLMELLTYRITGHSRRDPALYQPDDEKKRALANEPIARFAKKLLAEGICSQDRLDSLRADVKAEVERSVRWSAPSQPEDALDDMSYERKETGQGGASGGEARVTGPAGLLHREDIGIPGVGGASQSPTGEGVRGSPGEYPISGRPHGAALGPR